MRQKAAANKTAAGDGSMCRPNQRQGCRSAADAAFNARVEKVAELETELVAEWLWNADLVVAGPDGRQSKRVAGARFESLSTNGRSHHPIIAC